MRLLEWLLEVLWRKSWAQIETQREKAYEFERWEQQHKCDECVNLNYFTISYSAFCSVIFAHKVDPSWHFSARQKSFGYYALTCIVIFDFLKNRFSSLKEREELWIKKWTNMNIHSCFFLCFISMYLELLEDEIRMFYFSAVSLTI